VEGPVQADALEFEWVELSLSITTERYYIIGPECRIAHL